MIYLYFIYSYRLGYIEHIARKSKQFIVNLENR